jgi:hypothetical protein
MARVVSVQPDGDGGGDMDGSNDRNSNDDGTTSDSKVKDVEISVESNIPIDLDTLIEEQDWERVYEHFLKHPEEARRIVNPSLGWTKLHWLCSLGSTPPALIELVASSYPEAITLPDNRYGDTPLHMLCRNSVTSAYKVTLLLDLLRKNHPTNHSDDDKNNSIPYVNTTGVLIRNRFGGTPLHSAANHNAVLPVLQALVETHAPILQVTTYDGIYPVSALWHSYLQTIPGSMIVARILSGETVQSTHFGRFWQKVGYLSTAHFQHSSSAPLTLVHSRLLSTTASHKDDDDTKLESVDTNDYVIHGLIQCHVQFNTYKVALRVNPHGARTMDNRGNLPLHVLVESRPFRLKEREAILDTLHVYPESATVRNHAGEYPLWIALRNKIPWEKGLDAILGAAPHVVGVRDPETGWFPFQLAALYGGKWALDTIYHLLVTRPDLLHQV